MSGRHLLDTNIIIALFKSDENVRQRIATSDEVFVPVIAIGELFYGAQHSTQIAKHMQQIEQFAKSVTVFSCDLDTAYHYGEIKDALKAKGRPLPENDIWISAIAKQHSLTVATRDRHFKEVDGLAMEEW